jgi:hypothetical protein
MLSSVCGLEVGQVPSRGVLFKAPYSSNSVGPMMQTGPVTGYSAATGSV